MRLSYKISIVFLFLIVVYVKGFAAEDHWEKMVERFLIPLTYPNFIADDFGEEPSVADRELLERFKPDIYIAPGSVKPIDFYYDYLPKTVMADSVEQVVKVAPDRAFLKSMERKKGYHLNFTGSMDELKNGKRVGYGQVIKEVVDFRVGEGEIVKENMTFLRYNFVFPQSGLPAKLPWYKEVAVSLLGDVEMWHLLDIHGAVHIVLNESLKPVVLILAQHNYHRTYLIDEKMMDGSGKVKISFSERSNEPYPAPPGVYLEYCWAADTPEHIEYIVAGNKPGLTTGQDVIYGAKSGGEHVEYKLRFLTDKDPLYTSWIPLGDKLKLLYFFDSWYRKGPPGMNLRTWPRLKKYGELMQFWYVKKNDIPTSEFMGENIHSFFEVNFDIILNRNGAKLYNDLHGSENL